MQNTKRIFISIIIILLSATLIITPTHTSVRATQDNAESYILMDYNTSTILKEHNPDQKLPIASVTKLMTLLLTFQRIQDQTLDYQQLLTASPNASAMGGSQVFIDANAQYTVRDLITAVVVSSANDASVVLAEAISGSEADFVQLMNEQADLLGMTNTHYSNATGLPHNEHYSSARDVAILMSELLNYPDYLQFSNIWMQDFVHPNGRITQMANTNKLLKSYHGCDAGKTGSTNQAGYCLSASAKRNNMRLISVVLGAENSKTRFDTSTQLLDWGFANFKNITLITQNTQLPTIPNIKRANTDNTSVITKQDYNILIKNGEQHNTSIEYEYFDLVAPIDNNTPIGNAAILRDGVVIDRVPLYLEHNISAITYAESISKVLDHWKLHD